MIKQSKTQKLSIKFILAILAGLAIAVIILVPAHFSIAALCALVFCIYSFYVKALEQPNNKRIAIAHAVVLVVLLFLAFGSIIALMQNQQFGCSSFYGGKVECFSYSDLRYTGAELVGSIIVIASLSVVQASTRNQMKK